MSSHALMNIGDNFGVFDTSVTILPPRILSIARISQSANLVHRGSRIALMSYISYSTDLVYRGSRISRISYIADLVYRGSCISRISYNTKESYSAN